MTHLCGKVAFVEALLYVGRSSIEIQHALLLFMSVISSADAVGPLLIKN